MGGYLFGLDSLDALQRCISLGAYSTKIPEVKTKVWLPYHEGAFVDYCSMKEGDDVYFFIERKVYGIGQLVNIGNDTKYLNFPNSNRPVPYNYDEIKSELLVDFGESSHNQRFICFFKPSPYFFLNGIDMDDVLTSNPAAFRILRVFAGLSFIKFGDEENQAFRNILLQRNADALTSPQELVFPSAYANTHSRVAAKLPTNHYDFEPGPFLSSVARKSRLTHEMPIEAALILQLSRKESQTTNIFGDWDYLSHQVVASPFKPVYYMDKMDVFGYSYIPDHDPTVDRYLVAELKQDRVTADDVLQLMKYVDWVKNEYAMGDYSLIHAFLVGHRYDDAAFNMQSHVSRNYSYGVRPTVPKVWNNMKFVRYSYNAVTNSLDFELIHEVSGS